MNNYTSNTQKKKKKKNLSKGEINVLITNVNKSEFLKLKNDNYLKYYYFNNTVEIPENFNIIIETCLSLSNQMEEKKFQIKKYSILSQLIGELYKNKPEYIKDYLYPFNTKGDKDIIYPNFVFIITTNNAYDFFLKSSKRFLEDNELYSNLNLYIFYIKFNLMDRDYELIKNNESIEINKLREELKEEIIKSCREELNKQNEIISRLKWEIDELKKKNNNK